MPQDHRRDAFGHFGRCQYDHPLSEKAWALADESCYGWNEPQIMPSHESEEEASQITRAYVACAELKGVARGRDTVSAHALKR
jgi:hypothetical protein